MKQEKQKRSKRVVAVIGPPNAGKTEATKVFNDVGFYRIDSHDKILDFVKTLFGGKITDENSTSLVETTKKRGCNLNRTYWLNLALSSIPANEDCIILDNFTLPELYDTDIEVFMIDRVKEDELADVLDEDSDETDHYKVILNAGDMESFQNSVRSIATAIKSSHLQEKIKK